MNKRIPFPVKCFTGRQKDLASVHSLLKSHSTVFLHGKAGIGKSEFLLQLIDQLKTKLSKNLVYFEFSGSSAKDEDLFSIFPPKKRVEILKQDTAEQATAWLDQVEKKKLFVFLDQVEKYESEVCKEILIQAKRYLKYARIIMASREPMTLPPSAGNGFASYQLVGLSGNDMYSLSRQFEYYDPIPSGLDNPRLFFLLVSNISKEEKEEYYMDFLIDSAKNLEKKHLFFWKDLTLVPIKLLESSDFISKNILKQLLDLKFLQKSGNCLSLSQVAKYFLPRRKNNEAQLSSLSMSFLDSLPQEDRSLYMLEKNGSISAEQAINFAEILINDNRIAELEYFGELLLNYSQQHYLCLKQIFLKLLESENYELSEKIHEKIKATPNYQNDIKKEISLINGVCELTYYLKDFEGFREILLIFDNIQKQTNRMTLDYLHWKALACRFDIQYKKAVSLRQQAIESITATSRAKSIFRHYFNLGIDLYWLSDYDKSYYYSGLAKSVASENSFTSSQQIASYNKCLALEKLNEKGKEREEFASLVDSIAKHPNPSLEISLSHYQYDNAFIDNDLSLAEDILLKASSNTKRYGTKNQQAVSELYLAELKIEQGEYNKAEELLKGAESFFRVQDKNPYQWRILRLRIQKSLAQFDLDSLRNQLGVYLEEISACEDVREKLKILSSLYCLATLKDLPHIEDSIGELLESKPELKSDFDFELLKVQRAIYNGFTYEPQESLIENKFLSEKLNVYQSLWKSLNNQPVIFDKSLNLQNSQHQYFLYYCIHSLKNCLEQSSAENFQFNADLEEAIFRSPENEFLFCRQLLEIRNFYNNLKRNQWDSASLHLQNLRKNFLKQHPKFTQSFTPLLTKLFDLVNWNQQDLNFNDYFLSSDYDLLLLERNRLIFDKGMNVVSLEGKKTLFDLLNHLASSEEACSKESIIQNVWKQDYDPLQHDQLLYVNINRLKKMLESHFKLPEMIINEDHFYKMSSRLRVKAL